MSGQYFKPFKQCSPNYFDKGNLASANNNNDTPHKTKLP